MRVYKDTSFELSFMTWELEPPRTTAMFVVKGTFDIVPGECTVADEPVQVNGEVPWEDGDPPSLQFESDYAVLKPHGEWYLKGHAHAAGGRPATLVKVEASVGGMKKQLAVWGDRVWRRGVLGGRPSDPVPFVSMPLRWERSFGGPGFAANPVGRGLAPVAGPEGPVDALPNIEDPRHPVVSHGDRPAPVGLGPIPSLWPARIQKAGTYDELWLKSRWPYFPRDFDFTFFNCAPLDQQKRDGYWRGDERIELLGVDPERPRVETRLPGVRARLFIERSRMSPPREPIIADRPALEEAGPPPLSEVPLKLDTIVIDADARQVICQWRGLADVADDRLSDVDRVFVVHEPLDADHPHVHYERWLLDELFEEADEFGVPEGEEDEDEEEAFDEPPEPPSLADSLSAIATTEVAADDAEGLTRRKEALLGLGLLALAEQPDTPLPTATEIRERLEAEGIEPPEELVEPELPPPPEDETHPSLYRHAAIVRRRLGRSFAGLDLSEMPYQGLDLSGVDFTGSILTGASLARANLSGAVLAHAVLVGADVSYADLRRADLLGADLSEVKGHRAWLEEARLDDVSATGADLTEARFLRASMKMTELSASKLDRCDFREVCLDGGDLSGSSMEGAGFVGSSMEDCSLEGVKARGAVFERTRMKDLRASDAADFEGANFVLVDAPEGQFQGARVTGANFSGSNLAGADFSEAYAEGANFTRAVLRGARFDLTRLGRAVLIQVDAFEATFEKADLRGADLRGAHLFSAGFFRTLTAGALFEGANRERTLLEG